MDVLDAAETLDDARVVEEALAFIDSFYASASDGHASGGTETETLPPAAHDEVSLTVSPLAALRTAVHELHSKLATARSAHHTGDYYSTYLSEAAAKGRAVDLEVWEIQCRLEQCQRLLAQWLQRSEWRTEVSLLEDKSVEAALGERMNQIIAHVVSGTSDRPLQEARRRFEDISARLFDDPTRGAAIRIRSGRYVPFKLSLLSKAAWQNLIDSSLDYPGDDKVVTLEPATEMFFRTHSEVDNTQGVMALRRTHLTDGSVMFCWASISAAPRVKVYHPTNPVGDCVTDHHGWIRVGLVTSEASTRPRVYLESVSDVIVQPPAGSHESPEVHLRRYARFKEFMHHVTKSSRNRQLMENKMLEWSLNDSCKSSWM